MGVTISRGELSKIIGKVSAALEKSYDELLALLPDEAIVNVYETGHKDNGKHWWTWCFRAELYTLYRIDAHRNAEVLMDTLGVEFAGVLGCDYFSAYRRVHEGMLGLPAILFGAFLIRDVKFLTTLPDARDRRVWGALAAGIERIVCGVSPAAGIVASCLRYAHAAGTPGSTARGHERGDATRSGQNMARRFREHGAAYFTFITTPGVEPTNNLAEQAIRFVVIDRHITQGTRSESGRRWSERIWTVIATCVQQGQSVHDFLRRAITAWFENKPAPSLLPGN